jgi:hypothetical protein
MTPKEKAPQTAVEWLVDQLEKHYVKVDIKNTAVFYQAKEIEKEQIVDAYNEGFADANVPNSLGIGRQAKSSIYPPLTETFKK